RLAPRYRSVIVFDSVHRFITERGPPAADDHRINAVRGQDRGTCRRTRRFGVSSSSSDHARARRSLIEEIKEDKKSWLRHGVVALAVSVLGLGVAGSVVLTGAAQHTTLATTVATTC